MIGIFDSGFGGLAVLKQISKLLPSQSIYYVADQANLPYSTKTQNFIYKRAKLISDWLISQGADLVVLACNTATVSTINKLRSTRRIPFVGIEPAIKPAANFTKTGKVAILATDQTLQSKQLDRLIKKFGQNISFTKSSMPNWVDLVESGQISGSVVNRTLKQDTKLLKKHQAVVLACTHYLFFTDQLKKLLPNSKIFDPTAAVAQQVARNTPKDSVSKTTKIKIFSTKKNPDSNKIVYRLLRLQIPVELVHI